MAPKIGKYAFDQMTGAIPAWKNEVETRERPGTDGYTFILLGKRSQPFQLQTVTLVSGLATARQRQADYAALCGSFVALETAEGKGYSAVMVLDVSTEIAPLLRSSDGSNALVRATWTLQRNR